MPVVVKRRGSKWRIVEGSTGRISKPKGGKARDGGGHRTKKKAESQARAINEGIALYESRLKPITIPHEWDQPLAYEKMSYGDPNAFHDMFGW